MKDDNVSFFFFQEERDFLFYLFISAVSKVQLGGRKNSTAGDLFD